MIQLSTEPTLPMLQSRFPLLTLQKTAAMDSVTILLVATKQTAAIAIVTIVVESSNGVKQSEVATSNRGRSDR